MSLPRGSLALTRQLEHYIASTPSFLLPAFNFATSPTSARQLLQHRSASTRASTSKGSPISDVSSTSYNGEPAAGRGATRAKRFVATAANTKQAYEEDTEETNSGAVEANDSRQEKLKNHRSIDPSFRRDENSPETFSQSRRMKFRDENFSPNSVKGKEIESSTSSTISCAPTDRKSLLKLLNTPLPTHYDRSDLLDQLLQLRGYIISLDRLDDTAAITALAALAIRSDHPSFALRLTKEGANLMHSNAASSTSIARLFEAPVRILLKRKLWGSVIGFTNAAWARQATSEHLLESKLHALYEVGRYFDVIKEFGLYEKLKLKPSANAFDELVGAHLHSMDLASAQQALQEKLKFRHSNSVQTALTLLDGMWKFGGNRVMEEKVLNEPNKPLLNNMRSPSQNVNVLNKIMSVRASRGDFNDAFAILDYFRLGSLRQFFQTRFGLKLNDKDLAHRRPSPDVATFVILSGIFVRQSDYEKASLAIVEAVRAGFDTNEFLIRAVIRFLVVQGKIQQAQQFLIDLPLGKAILPFVENGQERTLTFAATSASAMAYQTLLSGILKSRGLEGAAEIISSLQETASELHSSAIQGMMTAVVDYMTLHETTPHDIPAKLIVSAFEISTGNLQPNLQNLNALLRTNWTRNRLKNSRKRAPLFPPESNTTQSTEIISNVSPSSDQDELVKVVLAPAYPTPFERIEKSLSDRQIQPDRQTLQHSLRQSGPESCSAAGSIESMWEYLSENLIERGIRPTRHHLIIIMKAYLQLGDGQGAHKAMNRAYDELGMSPHVACYSVLLSGYARLGKFAQAEKVWQEMLEMGIEPDQRMFYALGMMYARKRDVWNVRKVIETAQKTLNSQHEKALTPTTEEKSCAPPDPIFVSIEYRALVASGRIQEAVQLLQHSIDCGMTPDRATKLQIDRTLRFLKRKQSKSIQPNDQKPSPVTTQPKLSAQSSGIIWTTFQVRRAIRRSLNLKQSAKFGLKKFEPIWQLGRRRDPKLPT